ncbi:MAG TPA: response regulator [Steroidobacteraceae bacterium]|nr:response regulator [Steroidobacteraceae bacterium]
MNGLLIDDDAMFLRALQRSLARRGIATTTAMNIADALASAAAAPLDFALVDLRIGKDSGLRLIQPLRAAHPRMRILLMTGFASVATAVEAIKLGADDYLLKPVNVEAILRALKEDAPPSADDPETMIPLSRLEWEHIQQALRATDGNVSAAARMLGMHRRSLQRKLAKRPGPERKDE